MRAVCNLLWACAGFVLGVLLLRLVIPRPPPFEDERELAEARHDCDVLFLGPSYVQIQIQPDVFDDEAARIGLDARACKLGASNLRSYELRATLERVLSERWARLKLVVVDITLRNRIAFKQGNWFKPRVLAWHTPAALPWLLEYYGRSRRPWFELAPLFGSHLAHIVANGVGIGSGAELLATLSKDGRRRRRRRREARTEVEHQAKVERLKAAKSENEKGHRYRASDWPLELRDVARSHGVEAYFLYAPVWTAVRIPRRAVHGNDRLEVLAFNDPERYPELYASSVRGSTAHLNARGALEYSKLLAREIKRRWRFGAPAGGRQSEP